MRIYLEHDAKVLGTMLGVNPPGCDGVLTRLGDPHDVLASTIRRNPLGSDWLFDAESPGATIVSWSGTLAPGLFQSSPMTWSRAGHDALARFCDDVCDQLARHERTLCFHPHSRHVLSDPQSCLKFLRERAGQPFGIAFAPASMLVASMMQHVEDHLTRAFEALGPVCSMIVLRDVRAAEAGSDDDADEPALKAVALGHGALPRDLVLSLLRQHVPETTPIVLRPERLEEQLDWLDAGMRA